MNGQMTSFPNEDVGVGGWLQPHCSTANIRLSMCYRYTAFMSSQFTDTMTEIRLAAMGQNPFGHTVQAQAACGDAVTDIGQDECVLILINHCRDMKQQETRLRLTTLLLLLSCTALYIFTLCTDLGKRENSGSGAQESAAEQSPAYSKQVRECPADNPEKDFQRLHIDLRSSGPAYNNTRTGCNKIHGIKWSASLGEEYLRDNSAIVIPKEGYYFVYVRIALGCHDDDGPANFRRFYAELYSWNIAYNQSLHLMDARDGIACTSQQFRSVFMGQLFHLLKGDHLRVCIEEGYKLITKSSFGAYLT
ncbi:hypothetical protein ABVT39_019453 [Epinephelus coioides]